jgi:hypothetical protein
MQWALVLFRLKKRNIGYLWEEYPAVEAYAQRLIARPQFQKGVVEYQTFSKVVLPILIRKLKNKQARILLVMGWVTGFLFARRVRSPCVSVRGFKEEARNLRKNGTSLLRRSCICDFVPYI